MKVTVIVPDQMIRVDGVAMNFPFPSPDPRIKVVHWFDAAGVIEYVDGSADRIELYAPIVEGFVNRFNEELARRNPPPTIADLRAVKIAAARQVLEAKIAAGFAYGGHVFQLGGDRLGTTGIQNITAKGADAAATLTVPGARAWPEDFAFIDASNAAVPMTAAEMVTFALAASDYVTALRKRFWALRALIEAVSEEQLGSIDVNSGWPD